jgi:hypothetical protein
MMTGSQAPDSGKPIAGEQETCEHEWVNILNIESWLGDKQVIRVFVCEHCHAERQEPAHKDNSPHPQA